MSAREEKEVERKRSAATMKRMKDIAWTAGIASVITIIVLLLLGWLTTQNVVKRARQEGANELVALRASICLVKFQQRPDAEAKRAEFKALSGSETGPAIRKFVTEEGLATMLGEDAPAPGAIDKCAEAIGRVSG
jgi:hypothetical protein